MRRTTRHGLLVGALGASLAGCPGRTPFETGSSDVYVGSENGTVRSLGG